MSNLMGGKPKIWVGLVSMISAAPAYAYIDPATGSMLIQGLLAGIVGLLVTFKLYWFRLKNFFASALSSRKPPSEAEEADNSQQNNQAK